jgi:uncharacterized repeat protein (TIGR04076 family)
MPQGHFDPLGEDADKFWKSFQEHNELSDEELARFRADPQRAKMPPIMASSKMRNSTMVVEVIESHACSEGLQVGDKLYFKGGCTLDTRRSSPEWCAFALTWCPAMALLFENMVYHNINFDDQYWPVFSCQDCGTRYGWGRVSMRAYMIDERPPDEREKDPFTDTRSPEEIGRDPNWKYEEANTGLN